MRSSRALAAIVALLLAGSARAQSRVALEGTLDVEGWKTDTSSNLLTRNRGDPLGCARLQLWGAFEPVRGVDLYALFEGEKGTANERYENGVEQAGLRWNASRLFTVDAGKVTYPVGAFANRRFSWRNPVIGVPDGYPVQYPYGVVASGMWSVLDYRAGTVSLPISHEGYTPAPSTAWRPAFSLGVTPYIGVRLGMGYTWGPYLNDRLTASQLAGQPWDSYDERIATADLAVSFGYLELNAEGGWSSYDVPGRAEPIEGLTYYGEGKYTLSPRLYVAARLERNDYPFIRPVSATAWTARKTDFKNQEVAAGFRLTATTLLKASYRWDEWHVTPSNRAFVRPGGNAFAIQLSQRFDVVDWVERARVR